MRVQLTVFYLFDIYFRLTSGRSVIGLTLLAWYWKKVCFMLRKWAERFGHI